MSTEVLHQPRKESLIAKAKSGAKAEQLSDNAANRIVGRTAWDVVSELTKGLRRPIISIPLSLGLATGITLLTLNGYVQVDYKWLRISPPTAATVSESAERMAMADLKKLITAGRAANRPYILEHLTVLISMEDVTHGKCKERRVNWKITHTIRALQPISNPDRLFKVRYPAAYAGPVLGTEKEVKSPAAANNVTPDMSVGEAHSFITLATFVYKLPLKNDRPALGGAFSLAPDQEFYSYRNEEDVIGELTILIESDTLDLNPVEQAVKRRRLDSSIMSDKNFCFNCVGNQRSLSARWKDVMPNEEVGLHFKVGRQR